MVASLVRRRDPGAEVRRSTASTSRSSAVSFWTRRRSFRTSCRSSGSVRSATSRQTTSVGPARIVNEVRLRGIAAQPKNGYRCAANCAEIVSAHGGSGHAGTELWSVDFRPRMTNVAIQQHKTNVEAERTRRSSGRILAHVTNSSARLTAFGRSTKERPPVLQYVLHVYTMNLGFAKRLVGDLSEDQMCAQPHGVVNHPAWSLGHLAVVADHLGKLLGLSSDLPAGWEDTFKTGGIPSGDRRLFPGKDELLRVIAQQHARISQGLSDADPAALARPHPNEKSRAIFRRLVTSSSFS
jgi:hypothetical protein